jgi:hypothetical protein
MDVLDHCSVNFAHLISREGENLMATYLHHWTSSGQEQGYAFAHDLLRVWSSRSRSSGAANHGVDTRTDP